MFMQYFPGFRVKPGMTKLIGSMPKCTHLENGAEILKSFALLKRISKTQTGTEFFKRRLQFQNLLCALCVPCGESF
jgi:hypothetical protein